MQLMIDINTETPAALRLCAQFLDDQAGLREKRIAMQPINEAAQSPSIVLTPNVTPVPLAPITPAALVVPTAEPEVPPAPSHDPYLAAITPIVPPVPSIAPLPVNVVVEDYDSSGVPFDTRIHQKLKTRKKDGTWKLQKGIAETLVSNVMQELAPRIRVMGVGTFGTPVPVAPIAVEVPPGPLAAAAPQVSPTFDEAFRALVRKITEARGQGRISVEEVNVAVASAGAPSLNLLGSSMPHLVPAVEEKINLILATR